MPNETSCTNSRSLKIQSEMEMEYKCSSVTTRYMGAGRCLGDVLCLYSGVTSPAEPTDSIFNTLRTGDADLRYCNILFYNVGFHKY